MIDPAIFENLQTKIDQETVVRDELHEIVQSLARKGAYIPIIDKDEANLTQVSTQAEQRKRSSPALTPLPRKTVLKSVLDDAATQILAQKEDVFRLAEIANKHPFYKYNGVWSRELQNLVYYIELCAWLGGLTEYKNSTSKTSFLTIEEVGNFLNVPVNLKDEDKFHLTIEEYLLSLISMVEELSRLAVNSVTLGDYHRPLEINNFIKDLFAGFQLLNLKNDILRKRSDGIKYSVKKVEDVVYDLSLRNLIPKA
ncbi:Translin [Penicillium occitanis (nom. inval.)]|nr:Translin [Penicillium occitanis (nom. inval.)]PCG90255.1 hypothetical protein PENOC_102950 [Penicillium occitanis (nom. inval.)]